GAGDAHRDAEVAAGVRRRAQRGGVLTAGQGEVAHRGGGVRGGARNRAHCRAEVAAGLGAGADRHALAAGRRGVFPAGEGVERAADRDAGAAFGRGLGAHGHVAEPGGGAFAADRDAPLVAGLRVVAGGDRAIAAGDAARTAGDGVLAGRLRVVAAVGGAVGGEIVVGRGGDARRQPRTGAGERLDGRGAALRRLAGASQQAVALPRGAIVAGNGGGSVRGRRCGRALGA